MKGCESCWQQCDLKHTPNSESWRYTSPKNKSKLVAQRVARVVHKSLIKAKRLREATEVDEGEREKEGGGGKGVEGASAVIIENADRPSSAKSVESVGSTGNVGHIGRIEVNVL